MQMHTFEDDLEALRLLAPPVRTREDFSRIRLETAALREAGERGKSSDTPALHDFNVRQARCKNIQSSIQAKAAAQPDAFISYVQGLNLSEMDQAFKYSDLIEAIIGNCSQWREFLLNELDRVLLLYEQSNSASVLQALQGFAFLEFCRDSSVTEAISERYAAALCSRSRAVRLLALNIFSGFRISNNATLHEALSECLSQADWKVRWEAEKVLAEAHLLPIRYRPSLADRIRRRLTT